jgi:hypothetical protein
MKKVFGFAVAFVLLISSYSSAQFALGLGIGAPVSGASIATYGHVDSSGVVHIDKTLDASPQILIEVHRLFKMNAKYGVAPFIGFAPKIDLGLATNGAGEQPIGAGFGALLSVAAGGKYRMNVGAMWLITGPIQQIDPAWQNGFQAPRSRQDLPLDISYTIKSVNRVMLTLTVSGIF